MTRHARFAPILLLLAACTTGDPVRTDGAPLITHYSQLAAYVGQNVVLQGQMSFEHEASGLYFSVKDAGYDRFQCVDVDPFPTGLNQGARVRYEGTLIAHPCASSDRVCLSRCTDYLLKRTAASR